MRTPTKYRRRWRMRLGEWILYHQREIVMTRCRWMGVRAMKNPLDAWIYQEIIHETRPEVIVELGSAHGGSALFLAHMLELARLDGRVVTVDARPERFEARHDRIVQLVGLTREALPEVQSLCEDKRTMVIHDASHKAGDVLADLRDYAPLVSPGCYFIVEDGVGDTIPRRKGGAEAGPLQATETFLREATEFEVDEERERYLLTYNPRGFLRRLHA